MNKLLILGCVNLGLLGATIVTDTYYSISNLYQHHKRTQQTRQQHNQQVLAKHAKQYNQSIDKHDRSMNDILQQSNREITATIFVGDLPSNTNDPDHVLKQLDHTKTPHNWMFPNIIKANGLMRWDTSANTDENFNMYLDLNVPAYTSQQALRINASGDDQLTCNFAYEIVLWSKQQPIAIYQCTTDNSNQRGNDGYADDTFSNGTAQHTRLDYPAAFTILDNHINPNTGKTITYQSDVAVFMRNRGDQPQTNHVNVITNACKQLPHLMFKLTNYYSYITK